MQYLDDVLLAYVCVEEVLRSYTAAVARDEVQGG